MDNENLFIDAVRKGFRPTPVMTVSQWAEANRVLSSKASAEPGRWRNGRTPYLVKIMDALSNHSAVEEVVFMKGAQIGATESGLNWIGYVIDHAPGPMMMVQGTVDLAKRASRQRLDPLIEECPDLKAKVSEARSRDSGNTMLSKEFPAGILILAGANSAAALRSMPVKYLFLDEEDSYPLDVEGEGSPVDLAQARTRTFSRRKIYKVSTPTRAGASAVERDFEKTDQQRYFVPCPDCNEFQFFEWKQLRWEKGRPETALYYCVHCGVGIEEHRKTWMMDPANGAEWRPTNPTHNNPKVMGFHLSSLYSPVGWYSWAMAAKEWEAAQDSQEKLRTFVNTVLGETWQEKGEAPEWRRLYERRENYRQGIVPNSGVRLTCAVDVQKDRLECHVQAWGRGLESWTVDYRVFLGDTSVITPDSPWAELAQLIDESFPHESGQGELPIRVTGIDSGYNTQTVYAFCRKYPSNKVVALKGNESQPIIIAQPKAADIRQDGKRAARSAKVWGVGTSLIKSQLYGWLKQEKPTAEELKTFGHPPGFMHFPEMGEDFFQQICSEQMVKKYIRGYPKYVWEKIRDRNEVLDTLVYGRALAALIGLDRFSKVQWDRAESQFGVKTEEKNELPMKSAPKTAPEVIFKKREDSIW